MISDHRKRYSLKQHASVDECRAVISHEACVTLTTVANAIALTAANPLVITTLVLARRALARRPRVVSSTFTFSTLTCSLSYDNHA